jgi:hypothetical protein
MKANIRPAGINLFILAPYFNLLSLSARKKPRNYRERSTYVNLEASRPTIGVDYFSNSYDLYFRAPGQGLDTLLDVTLILFVSNNFRTQNQGCGNGALMHRISGQFAARKPAFWCQKNEYQNDHTKEIPLPRVPRVIPEKDLLQCGNQGSHVLTLASKQPQDAWLAGQLIVNG